MNNYYLERLDDVLIDIDISNALFTEANGIDFITHIKDSLIDLQIQIKEYGILQDSKVKSKDGKTISKYKKEIDDRIQYLLSLKSKNINQVDCYDYSKIRSTFPNMLDSINQCIDANLIKKIDNIKDIEKGYKTYEVMLSDFSDLLDKYSYQTRLSVDTCIDILRDSEKLRSDSSKYLTTMFTILNKFERKISELENNDIDETHIY